MKEQPSQRKAGQRIAKVIARAGLASRREAEAWIAAGRIAVNGTTIASPAIDVTGSDRITVDGEHLPARQRTRLFLYHKRRGLMTTHADPQGRPTIFQNLRPLASHQRWHAGASLGIARDGMAAALSCACARLGYTRSARRLAARC